MSSVVLVTCLASLLTFVLGVMAGRKWEMLNAPPDGPVEVFHTYQSSTMPLATIQERNKCNVEDCGVYVKNARHDGQWRCKEHKVI